MNGLTDDAERLYDGAVGLMRDPAPANVERVTDDGIELLWVQLETPITDAELEEFLHDIEHIGDLLDCQIVVTDDRATPTDVPDDIIETIADRVVEKLEQR